MLLKNSDWPEEDELVLANVTKVNPNSVFCTLDHYGGRTGLIHISEISPGRIRNIRDFVIEGKKVICKILRVDREKGHIDLSLRRVTEIQRRNFNEQLKQEQKAEKLLKNFAEQEKTSFVELEKELLVNVSKDYDLVYDFFTDVIEGAASVSDYFSKKDLAKKLEEYVKDKITPKEVSLKTVFQLSLFQPDGVELIKKTLKKFVSEHAQITYQGAGKYALTVSAKDYKPAEKEISAILSEVEKFVEKNKGLLVKEER